MKSHWTDRWERWAARWQVPPRALPGVPVLTVTGRGTAVIENCGSLLEYGPECISVCSGDLILRLLGRDLTLRAMNGEGLAVTGLLSGVEYVSAGEEA